MNKKIKYYINNLTILMILLILLFSFSVKAETIIYDNITSSNQKILKISDDINLKYLNEYKYEIYVNGYLYNKFNKDDIIYIPDNSNIVIKIPDTIKTDLSNPYVDFIKPILTIVLSFLFTFLIVIVILYTIYKKVIKQ